MVWCGAQQHDRLLRPEALERCYSAYATGLTEVRRLVGGIERLEQAVLGSVVAPIAEVDPPNEGNQLAHRAGLRSLLLLLAVQVDVHKLLQLTRSEMSDLWLRQLDTTVSKSLAIAGCQSGKCPSGSHQQGGQGPTVWGPMEPAMGGKSSTVSMQKPAFCPVHFAQLAQQNKVAHVATIKTHRPAAS